MKYMGSKNRIAKDLLTIILKDRKPNQWYVEPFVGGCNMIDKVGGDRIGADSNKYLISMLKGLQRGIKYPKSIDKSLYDVARDVFRGRETRAEHLLNMSDDVLGWIGFMASYNGRFFDGGYSGNYKKRDYIKESILNIEKQIPLLNDITFKLTNYNELDIPDSSIIYCDPPYGGTKEYSTSKFDSDSFWEWCRDKSREGHSVFVSEYNSPKDFECVWEKKVKTSINHDKTKKAIEKLFKIKQ